MPDIKNQMEKEGIVPLFQKQEPLPYRGKIKDSECGMSHIQFQFQFFTLNLKNSDKTKSQGVNCELSHIKNKICTQYFCVKSIFNLYNSKIVNESCLKSKEKL